MISLCYVSSSTRKLSASEMVKLLRTSQVRNATLNITGLLLYNGKGTYLQALEGDEINVRDLYGRIKQDPRHQRVHKIVETKIESRDFPHWKMGFKNVGELPTEHLDAFSHFMDEEHAQHQLSENTSLAFSLLHHFKHTSNSLMV